ncbi:MAG: response regulator, partial [Nitrospinota bacterium]|nr:response regulator [Nitrospinota bacterium]
CFRDVTERKKAEMALKQLIKDTSKTTGEDFFKTIAKSLNRLLGVGYSFISVIAGHEEKILETVIFCKVDEILPNFQYGYEGTPCEILISEKRFVCFSGNVAQTFPKDEWLSINNIESYAAIPLFDSRGKFLGHMGVMDSKQFDSSDLNISIMKTFAGRISSEIEREETERERSRLDLKIQQTQKLESLGLLSGGIAHDFNNLLTAIVGDCDLVMEELEAGSASYGRIAEIKNAARQAAELSHQMLVYSGRGKIRISPINLNDILKEMSYLIERSTSKKVSVEFHLEEGLPLIMADVVQVRQVILNLAINASEAIGGGQGAISISTSSSECDSQCLRNTYLKEDMKEGLYVSMKVSDTGAGMDSDSISKIFDPFFTTKFKGRGLGLSAILGIIRKHKAAIKVESQVGRGTTFNILFPCASAPKIETPSASAEVQEPHPASGLALVVDDEEVVRNVAVKMFELMGFTAISAVNGIEALGIFKEKHDEISLILLDLTMPQMDGLECLTAIREIDKVVHIIISSGYDKSEVDQLLEGKGASGFLQKPFDMKMIRDVVKKVYEDALPQPGP